MAEQWHKGLFLSLVLLLPVLSLQKMCPAGSHLSEESQECTPCIGGVGFTEYENNWPSCSPCRHCRSDEEEQHPCTPKRDTECICKAGTFFSAEHPEMCRKCTRCPDGKREVSACTPRKDTECGDQPHGNSMAVGTGLGVSAFVFFLIWLVWRCCCSHSNPVFETIKSKLCMRCRRSPGDSEAEQNVLNEMGTYKDMLLRDERDQQDSSDSVLGNPERAPAGPRQAQERKKRLVLARGTNCADILPGLFCDFPGVMPISAWKHTMRRLGLSDCEIDNIQQENSADVREQIHKMLILWLRKEGLGISVNSLLDALDAQGLRLPRERIEDVLIKSGKFIYDDEGADPVVLHVEDF